MNPYDVQSRAHRIAQIICLYRQSMKYDEMVDLLHREMQDLGEAYARMADHHAEANPGDAKIACYDIANEIRGALNKTKIL